jgi:hypothetical protein
MTRSFAGMTRRFAGMTRSFAGMTRRFAGMTTAQLTITCNRRTYFASDPKPRARPADRPMNARRRSVAALRIDARRS